MNMKHHPLLVHVGNPIKDLPTMSTHQIMYPQEDLPVVAEGELPKFVPRKIRNGYILRHYTFPHGLQEDYCVDAKELGERVTAIIVEAELKGAK